MAETSAEVKQALETIFAADSDMYQTRGFQRRIGYGERPALVIIDLAHAWTRPDHAFTCDGMETIIPTNQALLKAARAKRIPVVYTTTAYQDPKGPRSDTGLWHMKIPVETLLERRPDHVLILAWNFADEIMAQQAEYQRRGGQFIIPSPTPALIDTVAA